MNFLKPKLIDENSLPQDVQDKLSDFLDWIEQRYEIEKRKNFFLLGSFLQIPEVIK